ncbi:MAG: hypothetical protein U1A24_15675 [Cypionkella sp.]|uniref:hypothetical protein n=1 Tax=Cypionkella sp. TaxID=2811411 RepID=UPI002AB9CBA2|nr:hypothetical protein [Cypionkella sp.]MDZ4311985.1 hypothetical protein [Cypionkella sp.]MDZ4394509.1 hypothetical protein [Cypionkella sp.]
MKRIVLPALLILAACGTPQQNCISGATRDMRVVDRLIAETERNLERGYAYETVTRSRTVWRQCGYRGKPGTPGASPRMCFDDVDYTEQRPKAIDLNAESAKLASLKAKRAAQAKAADPSIRACRAQYPE